MFAAVPTLAVGLIYCLWYTMRLELLRRQRLLRERVAYLLWVVAHQEEEPCPEFSPPHAVRPCVARTAQVGDG